MTEPGRAGARLASRVAARTAHDLNNIAAVVSGHIYLLRSGAEPMEEAFEAMEKAMEHMERLTKSLTALGMLGLEPVEAIDVNEALRETLAGAGAGSVEFDPDPELPKLSTRRADLIRAVDALVQNARESSEPGLPARVVTRKSGAGTVEITVEDSGTGVPEEARRRNFDPLFSTKGPKGRGIGVALASAYAASQGGTLSIEDRPEGGTRARIVLPIPEHQAP